MLSILLMLFLVFLIFGMPVAFCAGIASALAIAFGSNLPLIIMPQKMFTAMDSFTLLAIPFFIISGELMVSGGMARRLINWASTVVGFIRGGFALACILATMIFSAISGSSVAAAALIGGVGIPAMLEKGYKRGMAVSFIAASASMGPIIPPSVIMIIYCSVTDISVGELFMAGVAPGILMGLLLMAVIIIMSFQKENQVWAVKETDFSIKKIIKSTIENIPAILAPIIILGGIVGGIFTATEAGVIGAVYSFIVSLFIYKEMKWKDIPIVLNKSLKSSATVLLIITTCSVFSYILAMEQAILKVSQLISSLSTTAFGVSILILIFYFIVGLFVDSSAAAIVLVPLLHGIAVQAGADPLHFAFISCLMLVIGGVTPPVGLILFTAISVAGSSIKEATQYLGPFLGALLIALIIAFLFPDFVTFIPRLIFN